MTSERRIEANRRNAAKSTGPRTAAGRQRVSQNARRHGLTQGPATDRVMHYFHMLLGALPFRDERPCEDGQVLAMALADAEARLERIRQVDFRFLEDCYALDRESAHLESGWELLKTSCRTFKTSRHGEKDFHNLTTSETKPPVIGRKEIIETGSFAKEMRRLLRYKKAAENLRHKALRAWINYIRSRDFSKQTQLEEMRSDQISETNPSSDTNVRRGI
jgi:hypothetical protein